MIKSQMIRTFVPVVFVTLFSTFFATEIFGQNGTLRGHIYNESTGEAISFGNVILSGTDIHTITDLDGFFIFSEIPAGTYDLKAFFYGFDTLATSVTLQADQVKDLKLFMTESSIQLQTINVSASMEQRRNEVNVSRITVTPKQIKALPSTGVKLILPNILWYCLVSFLQATRVARFISGVDHLCKTSCPSGWNDHL